jgi:hypothetical protein
LLFQSANKVSGNRGTSENGMVKRNDDFSLGMNNRELRSLPEHGRIDSPAPLVAGEHMKSRAIAEQCEAIAAEDCWHGSERHAGSRQRQECAT